MLQGGNPGRRGSTREHLLVKAQYRREQIEDMRFLILMRSNTLDRTNADEIEKFNELLREYQNILDPQAPVNKKRGYEEKASLLKNFNEDFKKNIKSGKFKNFQKVKDTWPTKHSNTK